MSSKTKHSLLVTVLALFAAANSAGCAWLSKQGNVAKVAALDCVHADLGTTVKEVGLSILSTVVGIVFKNGSNWKADLDALAAEYGSDVVACAAHEAVALFGTDPLAGKSSKAGIADPAAAARAQAWIDGRGVTFAK